MLLEHLNEHGRDKNITFDEPTHVYTIHGKKGFTSVTTWNHHHFAPFEEEAIISTILKNSRSRKDPTYKYFQRTREQIKEEWETNRVQASTAGTKMHLDIENYYNGKVIVNDSLEFSYFRQFVAEFQLKFPFVRPYRTEWIVYYEELKIAGSIDMVFEDTTDGTLWIYDWKRCKEIVYEPNTYRPVYAKTECIAHVPDTNFWHYSLQLNVYRHILQTKYGKTVTKMCLVCLHPNNATKTYELFEVLPMDAEMQDLCAARLAEVAEFVEEEEEEVEEEEEEEM